MATREVKNAIHGDANIQAGGDINIALPPQARLASIIAYVVPILAQQMVGAVQSPTDVAIIAKLDHNSVRRYRQMVEEYAVYGGTVERILEEVDDSIPRAKTRTLGYFREVYLRTVAKSLPAGEAFSLAHVRTCADELIDQVVSEAVSVVADSNNTAEISVEDLRVTVTTLTCYAFIACKVLEKPT